MILSNAHDAAQSRPVILMRPGEANNRLAEQLEALSANVWRWPAFRIELPQETDLITERLSNLDDVEMVVLPSPAAVTAVAHWVREWPEHITLATVGEGTARVIRAAWGDKVKLIYPEGARCALARALPSRPDGARVALRAIQKHRERRCRALRLCAHAARA